MISDDIKALREWTTMPDGPLSSRLTRVLDALEKRTEALKFYAEQTYSLDNSYMGCEKVHTNNNDYGSKARAALEEK